MGNKAKLSTCGLAMGCAVVWGLSMLAMAYLSLYCGIGTPVVNMLGSLYMHYEPTVMGGVIGMGWGLVDGFITGFLIAAIHNWCARCCNKRCETKCSM